MTKGFTDLIATTWKTQAAPETVASEYCGGMSIIRNHTAGESAANC